MSAIPTVEINRRSGTGISNGVLGLAVFIASEVMFFGALFATYFATRAQSATWPPPGIPHIEVLPVPAINTAILLASSVTMHWATLSIRRGSRRGLMVGVFLTMLLGIIFLSGQLYEYAHVGFSPGDGVFGSLFFTMTGFHGARVFGGVAFLSVVWVRALLGQFSPQRYLAIEACGIYWHFVDAVWIALFTTLYLL